jgi:hypothetical protein
MKKYVVFIAFFLTFLLFVPLTSYASQGEQFIIINKKTNRLAFFDNGKLVKIFPVGTGKTRNLTPEGTFKIVNKIKNRPYYKENIPGGDPRNPLGDRWLGLYALGTYGTTYGIHGTNNEYSIGKYVSAGCVRMHNKDVRWLFDQVKLNTTVIITYSSDSFEKIAYKSGYPINEEQILLAGATEQGKILQQKLAQYQAAINSGDIVKIDRLYDEFRKVLRNTELKIGKVPGESNRKALGQKYITPAKVAVERTIYEVSQYRLLGKIEAQIRANQIHQAEANMAKLERLKKRAVEIKKAGNYSALPITISRTLIAQEASLEGELLKKVVTEFNAAINSGSIANVNNLYDRLSSKIDKTEKKIGLVYGPENRKQLLSNYVHPAKIAMERTVYEVSQFRLLGKIEALILANNIHQAEAEMAKMERLKKRAVEIKKAGNYAALPITISRTLLAREASLEGELLKKVVTEFNAAINSGSITNVNNLYDRLSTQLDKTEKKIGLVYGSENRNKLLFDYATPAKIAKERTIYEVSQYRLMQKIDQMIAENKLTKAKAEMRKLSRLKQRASEIKQSGGYENLPAKIYAELEEFQKLLEKKLEGSS